LAQFKATSTSLLSILTGWLLLSVLFVGCGEDPGVVGSSFIDEDAQVNSDTVKVTDFQQASITTFSGKTPYVSVGEFDDQLFGNVKSTGLFRPRVDGVSVDTIAADASMSLALSIQNAQAYGDTTADTQFDIVEISDPWRASSWRRDSLPNLTNNVIASASIGMDDTVSIDLPNSFRDRYRDYFYYEPSEDRQSNYDNNFWGFALVPSNTSKIIAISAVQSALHIRNIIDTDTTEADTTDFNAGFERWAYSLERSGGNIQNDQIPIYNTYENISHFNTTLSSDVLGTDNISRLELALYQDNDAMEASLGANEVRPSGSSLKVLLRDEGFEDETLVSNPTASFSANVDSADFSYRYDMTIYANTIIYENEDVVGKRYYLILGTNTGIINSTVLKTPDVSDGFPKLLITSVKPTVTN
jgi:hypothetical protein